ncbi:hypothetical protein C8K15_1363 [Paenisporosarcina sp. OV554]|nr:hypothetical protein C8K15_1363 [Paenisporosarcina sp. OV554]
MNSGDFFYGMVVSGLPIILVLLPIILILVVIFLFRRKKVN